MEAEKANHPVQRMARLLGVSAGPGSTGAPRIRAALVRKGTGVDRKTVASSMRGKASKGSPTAFPAGSADR